MRFRQIPLALTFIASLSVAGLSSTAAAQTASRVVGSITAISGHTLTIQPDNGAPSNLTVSDTARILRSQPGAKKISEATPIALGDLAIGDRVLALVNAGTATTVIAMKQADIAQKQQADAADWTARGTGGLVKTVDAAAGTVTIASGARTLTVRATPKTIIRRYSPDSAQFAKATPSTLEQIRPGDELRVRGDRNADRSEITADEIIAGTFRNLAGTVLSTNPAENTVTINDRTSKKPVVIHITAKSQLHKLPSAMAQELAARFERLSARSAGGQQKAAARQAPTENRGEVGHRSGNLSQMLERTPTVALSDLHKGDAVMIVATQGTPSSATAVTLLAGVEPLLNAFPSGNQSLFSASWNLNGGGPAAGGGEGAP
jgi:hypothetical protein